MADDTREKYILLAVNGTLMRGLELEGNLLEAGAEFGFEARTEKCYRLWSICDRNPAMIRVDPKAARQVRWTWKCGRFLPQALCPFS